MTRLTNHVRRNVVAYLALFVALGGTSYAAVSVRDHSLVPQKFNPTYMGGYVRAWVSVDQNGHKVASAGGVRVGVDPFITGHYVITWQPKPRTQCTAVGTVATFQAPTPGYLILHAFSTRGGGQQTIVQTYNSQGQATPFPFDVALLCATPH
jgi:hypothetical protein